MLFIVSYHAAISQQLAALFHGGQLRYRLGWQTVRIFAGRACAVRRAMCRSLWRFTGLLVTVFACTTLLHRANAQQTRWVTTGITGRLIYAPDVDGDRIPDFSMVGYGAGKRAIPENIPVVIHID